MRPLTLFLASCALAGAPAHAADPAHPTVIELFQSQGCSSCPPANAVLNRIAGRADLLALNFAVTYWDYLGWKDSFARPEFTQRQRDYAGSGGHAGVFTPQMVINGRGVIVGSRQAEVDAAIARYDRQSGGPGITAAANGVAIGPGPARRPAIVWLVAYDPRVIAVPVRAGENQGRTLPHRNIVRRLTALGTWSGPAARFALPPRTPGLECAILVQDGRGGPILAARRI